MWLEKLKLNKALVRSITDAGFINPKEVQAKTLSRIAGGQDIIAIGPEGCGKTSTYVLAVLNKIKQGFEEAPRALVLVPDKEKVDLVVEQFNLLNKNKTIRIVSLYATSASESQLDELADGCDIVVATPDRARAVYLKLALNLNKISILVIDDADLIVKQGLQLPVVELANSIQKCQHLVFAEVYHDRLEKTIDPFMSNPFFIEIDELEDDPLTTVEQFLYLVPNFKTKMNLLVHLLGDAEVFSKAIVFVNTRLSAEKVFRHLKTFLREEVAILNPVSFESKGFASLEEFYSDEAVRVLVIADELKIEAELDVPFIINVELPVEKEVYINRILTADDSDERISLILSTDLELSLVRKVEQAIGRRIAVADIPEEVAVHVEQKPSEPKVVTHKVQVEERGAAFHEKKASNAKDYNYSSGEKARMNKKKKYG